MEGWLRVDAEGLWTKWHLETSVADREGAASRLTL
jgi:hypothetical protein